MKNHDWKIHLDPKERNSSDRLRGSCSRCCCFRSGAQLTKVCIVWTTIPGSKKSHRFFGVKKTDTHPEVEFSWVLSWTYFWPNEEDVTVGNLDSFLFRWSLHLFNFTWMLFFFGGGGVLGQKIDVFSKGDKGNINGNPRERPVNLL